jgi:hypothetical protein
VTAAVVQNRWQLRRNEGAERSEAQRLSEALLLRKRFLVRRHEALPSLAVAARVRKAKKLHVPALDAAERGRVFAGVVEANPKSAFSFPSSSAFQAKIVPASCRPWFIAYVGSRNHS